MLKSSDTDFEPSTFDMTPTKARIKNLQAAARAYERRVELLHLLCPDGRCAICKRKPRRIDTLHIDHQDGRTWSLHTKNRFARVGMYWREQKAGVRLRGLCIACNNKHRPPKTASVPHPRKRGGSR